MKSHPQSDSLNLDVVHGAEGDKQKQQPDSQLAAPANTSPLSILEAAVKGGITSENVAVVEKLIGLARAERAEQAKADFARAFFQLRKNMPTIHADKQAHNRAGEATFVYCSEEEIAKMLEPHLMNYGFAMLFGQKEDNGRITVRVTLMHEKGHSEDREFTVRSGQPNAMKDAAMCDAGAATTALRHLLIKLFGLKSRIQENQDVKNEGEKITPDKIAYLREQCAELGGNTEQRMLTLGGVEKWEDLGEHVYPVIVRAIEANKRAKGGRT